MIEEERKQVFGGGWVTALDVSPFLRMREIIESLAAWCGGLEEEEDPFFKENSTREVCFKGLRQGEWLHSGVLHRELPRVFIRRLERGRRGSKTIRRWYKINDSLVNHSTIRSE